MAYGLDIEEIYCADEDRNDIGVLNTYVIQLDVADEKDFEIDSPEPIIPAHGIWYIPDTEYGGIVDAYETDSDEDKVVYTGRSWRGILHSHYFDFGDSRERLFNTGAGQEQYEEEGTPFVTITDVINALLEEVGVDDLFVCDEPDTDESVYDDLTECIVKRTDDYVPTLYDAVIQIADSRDMSLLFNYNNIDKMVHIVPILKQDYSEYMQYSNIATLGFQIEIDAKATNHVIGISENKETGRIRNIHVFADSEGVIQPYATTDTPIKDADYILDKSNQVLFGVDEIAEIVTQDESETENYELVPVAPDDWTEKFGTYFFISEETDDDGEVSVSYNNYYAEPKDVYTLLTKQPKDWATNYSSYYTRSWNPLEQKYDYSAVSAVTTLGRRQKITKQPKDWRSNYSDYAYLFWTGTNYEYRNYAGVPKNKYYRMTKKPDDWKDNFSSYYRKVYKKVTYTRKKLKSGKLGKKKKVVTFINCVDHKDAFYKACTAEDDRKGGKVPKFKAKYHYRREQYEVAPSFNKKNCYKAKQSLSAPPFNNPYDYKQYYKKTVKAVVPNHDPTNCYRLVKDHYEKMVESAIDVIEQSQKTNKQSMFLDDFEVNIGDTVGGKDEFTDTRIIGEVTNINVRLENGLIDAEYEVVVDLIQSAIIKDSIEESEETE